MSGIGELVVGLVILVGLVGVVIQVLPGGLIVLGAIGVWAAVTGGAAAWTVLAVAVLAVVASSIAKVLLAGRHLARAGVPNATLVWGGVVGVIGFFVIPVVGLPVGFVAGVYLVERRRRGEHKAAWQATVAALAATGITILVEVGGVLVAAGAWIVGLLVT